MHILISEPTKETLEKNGWKKWDKMPIYTKNINKVTVCVQVTYYELPHDCWIPNSQDVTPDDLIAIANELKKLEENK